MAHVTVNGIELHYDRVGEGPPLLLLHGLGSSARDWENQVSHFRDSRELIVPDFRGHGRSDKPDGPYSIEGFASDIAELVDELGIGPAPPGLRDDQNQPAHTSCHPQDHHQAPQHGEDR